MTGQWWESLARIVWWLASRVLAPVMAIAWPVFAIYGGYHVPPQDMQSLQLQGGEFALLIGTGAGGSDCNSGPDCTVIPSQHSYIILPQAINNAAVTLIENRDGDISRSVSRVKERASRLRLNSSRHLVSMRLRCLAVMFPASPQSSTAARRSTGTLGCQ
jgi:hypothetical protein